MMDLSVASPGPASSPIPGTGTDMNQHNNIVLPPLASAIAPTYTSPSGRPIAIAPKPAETPSRPSYGEPSGFQSVNKPSSAEFRTPSQPKEFWSDTEKYDLLWSIALSAGVTISSIPWERIQIPRGHSQHSAALIVQDIALGKHHITHPSFTPSNSNVGSIGKPRPRPSTSKKRKLQDDHEGVRQDEELPHGSTSRSGSSSSASGEGESQVVDDSNATTEAASSKTPVKRRPRRRHKSESPIELDLSNPSIVDFLKKEGYMNEDGTPSKKKRGRPTKDPFGLSVTLKKRLLLLDPNAPPAKKRGRPRKRFLEIGDVEFDRETGERIVSSGKEADGEVSPGLRKAIERIGEQMDRDVEDLLDESRRMEDPSEGSDSYEGWDNDSDNEGSGTEPHKVNQGDGMKNQRGENYMMIDSNDTKTSSLTNKAEPSASSEANQS